KADELPRSYKGVSVEDPLVPRAPAAYRRARHRLSVRAWGHAARDAARPRVHAGRLAHFLLVGAGAGRDRESLRSRARVPERLRVHRAVDLPVDTSREAARLRRALGQGRGGAAD